VIFSSALAEDRETFEGTGWHDISFGHMMTFVEIFLDPFRGPNEDFQLIVLLVTVTTNCLLRKLYFR